MWTTTGRAAVMLLALACLRCGSDTTVSGSQDVTGQADGAADGQIPGQDADIGGATDATEDSALPSPDTVQDAGQDVSAPDVPPPVCSAEEKKACDDGLACTTDECTMPFAVCKWTLQADSCLIGGVCRLAGEGVPGDACRQCDPAKDKFAWTLAGTGAACDDGKPCTFNDHCVGGACTAEAVQCDDGNACTSDACDPKMGCTYPALTGTACDDGSACSSGDKCVVGLCGGVTVSCDDGNPCTNDSCDLSTGCTHTENTAPCSDGNATTVDDACGGGQCVPGAPINCDDGNTCTLDVTDQGVGCYHLPTKSPCCQGVTSICDDGNPCTSDDCGAGGACSHVNNTAVCEDGNACTAGDLCAGGACQGKPKLCDDKNPCTTDSCNSQKGCVFTALAGGACDDGDPCTQNDTCGGGTCQGSGQCACTPAFAKQANKLTYLQMGSGGKPGEGLDLDDNAKTCAPTGNCSGGIDNALGALAGVANGPLDKTVQSGGLIIVLEYKQFKQGPIALALYPGAALDPANATCDVQQQACAYVVPKSLIEPQNCGPVVSLPGTLAGNTLTAGGKGTNFPFSLPIQAGVNLSITIYDARLQASVTLQNGAPTAIEGILAGAVPKDSLLAAIDALPDEGLPIPKDGLKAILDASVTNDMDTNGDGTLDAASIGLKLKGSTATITGTK